VQINRQRRYNGLITAIIDDYSVLSQISSLPIYIYTYIHRYIHIYLFTYGSITKNDNLVVSITGSKKKILLCKAISEKLITEAENF
jgi:hypothetical protein